MNDQNSLLTGVIFEELSNRGILDHINAKFLSKVSHAIQNSNIEIEKNSQRINTSEDNKIAFLLVMNYLKKKGMIETIQTITEELPNNPLLGFQLTPEIGDELYMEPEKCPDVKTFMIQSNFEHYKFEYLKDNRNHQLESLKGIIATLSQSKDNSKRSKSEKK